MEMVDWYWPHRNQESENWGGEGLNLVVSVNQRNQNLKIVLVKVKSLVDTKR